MVRRQWRVCTSNPCERGKTIRLRGNLHGGNAGEQNIVVYVTFFIFIFPSAKRQMRKVFDEEWGSMNTEGNIWWRGSVYDEWVDVMGTHWIGWICERFCLHRNDL